MNHATDRGTASMPVWAWLLIVGFGLLGTLLVAVMVAVFLAPWLAAFS